MSDSLSPAPPEKETYEMADPPERIFGVDFSAASADAGEKTWISEIDASGRTPAVRTCAPANKYLDCESTREQTIESVVSEIGSLNGDTAVGFDFPFGVPEFLLRKEKRSGWRDFIEWFPEEMADPDDFSEWGVDHTRAHTDGERAYLGRRTDDETGGKCAYGFIARYPAFYGMKDVLKPLVESGEATVVPMMDHEPGRPLVLETYPAAVLDKRGLCRENYKGDDDSERRRRRRNLKGLTEHLELPDDIGEKVVGNKGGDGLDSLAAAVSTYTNTREPGELWTDDREYLLEARIYD